MFRFLWVSWAFFHSIVFWLFSPYTDSIRCTGSVCFSLLCCFSEDYCFFCCSFTSGIRLENKSSSPLPRLWVTANRHTCTLSPQHVHMHANTHKEFVLACAQPKEAGHCCLQLSGSWHRPISSKQQPDVSSRSGDSSITWEIFQLAKLLKGYRWVW